MERAQQTELERRRRRSDRWRPVRWLSLTVRKGWRFERDLQGRPNVLVSPRGRRFEFRQGMARAMQDWWAKE